MDKAMQEAPQYFQSRMFNRDRAKPKEQRILVLKTGIAGKYFHVETSDERIALQNLKPGDELLLYREPDNKYDQWAIGVYLSETDLIGYISRYKNEAIARLMDAGKKFIAVVDEPNTGDSELEDKRHREAPTEDRSLPFSVYLIEET